MDMDHEMMIDVPCHQMPDGTMMGNCDETSSEALPYSQSTEGLSPALPSEVVELGDGESYDLVAKMVSKEINGNIVKMLGYNGMIPGPMLKVKQGSQVTINFTNQTDEEAMLHSHGLRLENRFDGTALVQKPVPIGGSYTYELIFPDTGIYWYHPHIREDYTQELGLYGNYFVQSEDLNYWSPVNQEVPLVLDDLMMDDEGIVSFDKEKASHTLMGRFGNVMLTNGETDWEVAVNMRDVVRFYVTNVSNARPYRLTIPGAQMKWVGGDASKVEREEFLEALILSPSERAVIEVLFETPGLFKIMNDNKEGTTELGSVTVSKLTSEMDHREAFNNARENQDVISEIDPFREYFDRPVDKTLELTMDMNMMEGMEMNMGANHKIEWEDEMKMMNQSSTSENLIWKLLDPETGKENMDIDWKFQKGDVVKIRLFNDPNSMHPMQHPIHLHGQRFLVLETNDERNTNLVWKDTTLVQTGDIVDILVEMSNPGKWMLHCHIAEHLEADMMLGFEVLDTNL